jgi:hypothetical protein
METVAFSANKKAMMRRFWCSASIISFKEPQYFVMKCSIKRTERLCRRYRQPVPASIFADCMTAAS